MWKKEGGGKPHEEHRSQNKVLKSYTCLLRFRPPQALKAPTPQIRFLKIHPPNLGGESSKITCFTVLFGAHSLKSGGEIFTSRIRGVWAFKGGHGSLFPSGHLKPVIRPVGRIVEISDSHGENAENAEGPPHPSKTRA